MATRAGAPDESVLVLIGLAGELEAVPAVEAVTLSPEGTPVVFASSDTRAVHDAVETAGCRITSVLATADGVKYRIAGARHASSLGRPREDHRVRPPAPRPSTRRVRH